MIPAYNEEEWLPRTLSSLHAALATLGESAQIIVVDNNSTDGTAAVAAAGGAEVVFEPVNQIARARNAGAARARGRYFVFLDADTSLEAETLGQAIAALESGEVCVGGALLRGETPFPGFSRWLVAIWTWISRTQQLSAGSFVFCTREGFEAVGGFNEKIYAGEEVWLTRRLKRWGRGRGQRFHLVEYPPVITSSRKGRMFGSVQLLFQFLLIVICPWVTRSRRLCWVWYQRPG